MNVELWVVQYRFVISIGACSTRIFKANLHSSRDPSVLWLKNIAWFFLRDNSSGTVKAALPCARRWGANARVIYWFIFLLSELGQTGREKNLTLSHDLGVDPSLPSVNRCIPLHCEGLQVEWSFKIPCSFSAESCDRCYQWPFLVVSYLLLLFCRMERTKNVHRKLSRARNQPNKMAVNKQRREVRSISTFLWLSLSAFP